jgi:hypothetical protein
MSLDLHHLFTRPCLFASALILAVIFPTALNAQQAGGSPVKIGS